MLPRSVAVLPCHLGWRTLLKCNKTNHACFAQFLSVMSQVCIFLFLCSYSTPRFDQPTDSDSSSLSRPNYVTKSTFAHAQKCLFVHSTFYVRIHVHKHDHIMFRSIYIYIYTYIYIYLYICIIYIIYIYIHIYIYIICPQS